MIAYNSGMVKNVHTAFRKIYLFSLIWVCVLSSCINLFTRQADAAQLSSRSLRIESAAPSATTRHSFSFSYETGAAAPPLGSVVLEYCTSPLIEITCTAPTGVDASGAVLADQTGETGFSILSAQTNKIILTRVPAQPPVANPSSYVFDTIVNPSTTASFFVRIATYTTADGTGSYTDFGSVANTTTRGVQISTEVPPILKFCVGLVLGDDCTTADESVVDLGELSTSRASSGTSQMIAATNAEFGLAIAVYGTTLTSGNNIIPSPTSPTVSAPGNAQFGMNLRDNSDPDVGQDPSGIGIANPATSYNTSNRYMFESGSVVATSPDATDSRKFTSSYIANISPTQPPGVYTATLTYICTATF